MINTKKVLILLSTYNGEKYLRQLLDSILAQTYKNIYIYVRDDGSRDSTPSILYEYENKSNNFRVEYGKNIGASKSFFYLLEHCDLNFDYFAFADQDDIWQPYKIERALNLLEKNDKKIKLYCSPTTLVDSNLQIIRVNSSAGVRVSVGNAVIENIACGCTMVFSKNLLEIIRKNGIPEHMYMHDWLVYIIGSVYGAVLMDDKNYIFYRQHENNTIGNTLTLKQTFVKRCTRLSELAVNVQLQTAELIEMYPLEKEQLEVLSLVKSRSLLNRIKMVLSRKIYRQNKFDNFLYKFYWLFWIG